MIKFRGTDFNSDNSTNAHQILIARHYLNAVPQEISELTKVRTAYLNAYLLSNFGIIVDKPQLLTDTHVKEIADLYKLTVPASFYSNPQDMKYFTKAELLIEQLVSYFLVETGTGIYLRPEIFEKDLPEYKTGDEIKLREFKIIFADEAEVILTDLAKAYSEYKRPWSLDETIEFIWLFDHGYYKDFDILCGDNAIAMLERDINFARFLFKKDLVKISITRCGENSKLVLDSTTKDLIRGALPLVKDCPMTKKQAKYFNTLINKVGAQGKVKLADNSKSPYARAQAALDKGDVLGAAKIYASNGSLLERNLKMLVSRADPQTALDILGLLPSKNPLVLFQTMSTLMSDDGNARTFTFTKNKLVKKHIETEYETTWRKSKLNEATRKLIHDACFTKIEEGYRALPSLGKVYIAPEFFKVGVPVNTSATGKGIDVLPVSSRLPLTTDKVRTFVHWKDAFDIDASLIFVDQEDKLSYMYFGNYYQKPFGNDVLFSGDCRDRKGTEYYDINLEGLKARGIKYVIQTFHGFCSSLNSGEIFCGYQNKENFNTKAWDPKNIELKIHVKGDTRAFMAFALDLTTNEVVILNQLIEDEFNVVRGSNFSAIAKLLNPAQLELNAGLIANYRGEAVENPEEADVVFASSYTPTEAQKVIRPFDIEKIVAIANGQNL